MNKEINNKVQELSNSVESPVSALTKEQIKILTDKLAEFNGFFGISYQAGNCCYNQHEISSNYKDGKISASLADNEMFNLSFSIDSDINENVIDDFWFNPIFNVSIKCNNSVLFTFKLNLLDLQFIKCCIDAVLSVYENCKFEVADNEQNIWSSHPLFLAEKEQIEKVQGNVKSIIESAGGIAYFGKDE